MNDKLYSPYQLSKQFIVIAQNPGFSQTKQLIKIECPYHDFKVYSLDPADHTTQ